MGSSCKLQNKERKERTYRRQVQAGGIDEKRWQRDFQRVGEVLMRYSKIFSITGGMKATTRPAHSSPSTRRRPVMRIASLVYLWRRSFVCAAGALEAGTEVVARSVMSERVAAPSSLGRQRPSTRWETRVTSIRF